MQEQDPTAVRAMLVADPYNASLRRHYLSIRTPELVELDGGAVRTHWDAMKAIAPATLGGLVIGVVVWAISWGVVAVGWTVSDNPATQGQQIIGILRMFATKVGLGVLLVAFSLTTGLFAWSCGLAERQRGRIAAELGPLPPDVPDTLSKARDVLLPPPL